MLGRTPAAVALALVGLGAALPARAQSFNYPLIIVPPPAQNLVLPKPAARPTPDKAKPADKPPDAPPSQHYQGRTVVPDRF